MPTTVAPVCLGHRRGIGDVIAVAVRDRGSGRPISAAPTSGNDGLPVYHGSNSTSFPPGVRSRKELWPSHVIASDCIGSRDHPAKARMLLVERSDGRSAAAVHQAPRAEARVAEGARAGVGELPAAARHHARPQAQHRLRGRALPQHRRVLAPRHGDLHDPRRHLHARLHLLRGGARQAGDARHRRAAPRRRSGREDGAEVHGDHLGRSRRSAGRRRRRFSRRRSATSSSGCPSAASKC